MPAIPDFTEMYQDGTLALILEQKRKAAIKTDNKAKKSNNTVPANSEPDELELRKMLASNIKTVLVRWELKKNELFPLLLPGVKKQRVTTYINGTSQPPLVALIRLERMTGISISAWLTRSVEAAELPAAPLSGDTVAGDLLSEVRQKLRGVLERLGG